MSQDAAEVSRRPMFRLSWWEPLAIFAFGYLLRLFNLGRVVNFLDDRLANVPTAFNYVRHGIMGPDNWFTQPAKHFLMYWDILVFGNYPLGWAMRQVLFGSVVVLLTYFLARRVFRAHFTAIFAAVLVALDPLSIAFSRASSEDPLAVAFVLGAMFFWVRSIQERRSSDLLFAGILVGTAVATRWYAVFAAAPMLAIALYSYRREGTAALAKTASLLGLVPLAAYVAWFLPWLARGNSIPELWSLQVDAFLVQQSATYPAFDPALSPLTGPGGWFVRWMGVGSTGIGQAYTVIMNNPVLWVLFVPAIAFLGWTAYRRRLPEYWLLASVFVLLYAFFVSVERPIYLYSALPLVPIGFAAVGFASGRLLRKWSLLLLALAVAWCAYLYPLTSAVPVANGAYAWLLPKVGLTGGDGR